MATIFTSCKCSNPNCNTRFDFTTVHYAGGLNDKETITVKCNTCGSLTELQVENEETIGGLTNCTRV